MGEGYCLELLRVPVRIFLFRVLEVPPELDVVVEVLKRVLEPVFEDGSSPVIGPSLVSVDDVH